MLARGAPCGTAATACATVAPSGNVGSGTLSSGFELRGALSAAALGELSCMPLLDSSLALASGSSVPSLGATAVVDSLDCASAAGGHDPPQPETKSRKSG